MLLFFEAGAKYDTSQKDCAPVTLAHVRYKNELPTLTLLKIDQIITYLEAKGKSKRTQKNTRTNLKILAHLANLDKPAEIELAIARYRKQNGQPATNSYKSKLCECYQYFCKFNKIQWEKVIYHPEEHSIIPPTEKQVAMLIASAKNPLSLKIELAEETGLRPCEIQGEKGLRVIDIHTEQKSITALSAKKCNARPPIKISDQLITRLTAYITSKNLKGQNILFLGNSDRLSEHFFKLKKRLAKKLNDPSIEAIRLYDIRHYYITKQLRRTQNTETVRIIVGHKHLNTTQKYLHLLGNNSGEWITEQTNDRKRADELVKADYSARISGH